MVKLLFQIVGKLITLALLTYVVLVIIGLYMAFDSVGKVYVDGKPQTTLEVSS